MQLESREISVHSMDIGITIGLIDLSEVNCARKDSVSRGEGDWEHPSIHPIRRSSNTIEVLQRNNVGGKSSEFINKFMQTVDSLLFMNVRAFYSRKITLINSDCSMRGLSLK